MPKIAPKKRRKLFERTTAHHAKPHQQTHRKRNSKSTIIDFFRHKSTTNTTPSRATRQLQSGWHVPLRCRKQKVKKNFPQKDIWCYSGYLFDTEIKKGRAHCEVTDEILKCIDVLVDGRFVEEKKNIMLKFRGSENQRIIDVKKSLENNEVVIKKGFQ